MAKKLLAELKVYLDDTPKGVSHLNTSINPKTGESSKDYSLILYPNSRESGTDLEKTNHVQILCHELGHFVGHVLNTEKHLEDRQTALRYQREGTDPSARNKFNMEQEAWNHADLIMPGASDSEACHRALGNYFKQDLINKLRGIFSSRK